MLRAPSLDLSDRIPERKWISGDAADEDAEVSEWQGRKEIPTAQDCGFISPKLHEICPIYWYDWMIKNALSYSYSVAMITAETGSGKTMAIPEMIWSRTGKSTFKMLLIIPGREACKFVCNTMREMSATLTYGYLAGTHHKVKIRDLETNYKKPKPPPKRWPDGPPNVVVTTPVLGALILENMRRDDDYTLDAVMFDEIYDRPPGFQNAVHIAGDLMRQGRLKRVAFTSAVIDGRERLARSFEHIFGVPIEIVDCTAASRFKNKILYSDYFLLDPEPSMEITPEIAVTRLRTTLIYVMGTMIEKKEIGHRSVVVFVDGAQSIKYLERVIDAWKDVKNERDESMRSVLVTVQTMHSFAKIQGKDLEEIEPNELRIYLCSNAAQSSYTLPEVGYVLDGTIQKVPIERSARAIHGLTVARCDSLSITQRMGRGGRTCDSIVIYPYTSANVNAERVENYSIENLKKTFCLEDLLTAQEYELNPREYIDPIDQSRLDQLMDEARLCGVARGRHSFGDRSYNHTSQFIGRQVRKFCVSVRAVKGLIVGARLGILRDVAYAIAATEYAQPLPYVQTGTDYSVPTSMETILNDEEFHRPGDEHAAIAKVMAACYYQRLHDWKRFNRPGNRTVRDIMDTVERMERSCKSMGLIPKGREISDSNETFNRNIESTSRKHLKLMRVAMTAAFGDHLCTESRYDVAADRLVFYNGESEIYPVSFLRELSRKYAVYNSGYLSRRTTAIMTTISDFEAVVFGNLFAEWEIVEGTQILMRTNACCVKIPCADQKSARKLMEMRDAFEVEIWNFAQRASYASDSENENSIIESILSSYND